MEIIVRPPETLSWNTTQARCVIGRGGVTSNKKEGDSATPAGRFPLRRVMYRPDRRKPPFTGLPISPLGADDGWCDEPGNATYNQLIKLPFSASHEALWRADNVYDVIVELGYNDDPNIPGLGSAIFMHVARPKYDSTEGCVALALEDLLTLLSQCDETAVLSVMMP